jgi:starch phosphorylase
MVGDGFFSHGDSSIFQAIYQNLTTIDHYLLMADYASYDAMQMQVSQDYLNKKQWLRKSILNTARMGKFSSDRTIQEYADEIWKVKSQNPVKPRTITKIL